MNNFNPFDFYYRSFKLGATYACNGKLFKFIKTTPKGFNLLNLQTNRVMFMNGHLYSKNWSHKEIPEPITIVKNVRINSAFIFTEIPEPIKEITK
jgi:hypothetical protein